MHRHQFKDFLQFQNKPSLLLDNGYPSYEELIGKINVSFSLFDIYRL